MEETSEIKIVCVTELLHDTKQQLFRLVAENNEVEFKNVLDSLNEGMAKIILRDLIPAYNRESDTNPRFKRYVHILLEKHMSFYTNKSHSCQLLMSACEEGDLNLVKTLVANGSKDDQNYAMSNACKHGHLEVLKYLIDNSISSFDTDNDYELRLPTHPNKNHRHIVQYVMEKTGRFHDAIDYALEGGNYDMVRWLVEGSRDKEGDDTREGIKITEDYIQRCGYLERNLREGDREIYNYLKSKVTQ